MNRAHQLWSSDFFVAFVIDTPYVAKNVHEISNHRCLVTWSDRVRGLTMDIHDMSEPYDMNWDNDPSMRRIA